MYADGGNKMYGVKGVSGYTDSWLHGFEEDPVYAARFQVAGTRKGAKAGFLIRRSSDTAYVRAGYDFEASKWYLEASEGADFETQRVYADSTFSLEKNKWYAFEVTAGGHSIEIKVDGQVVLSSPDTIDNCGFGRIGVYSENADFYIDDVKATFKNGGAVTDGVVEVTVFRRPIPTIWRSKSCPMAICWACSPNTSSSLKTRARPGPTSPARITARWPGRAMPAS